MKRHARIAWESVASRIAGYGITGHVTVFVYKIVHASIKMADRAEFLPIAGPGGLLRHSKFMPATLFAMLCMSRHPCFFLTERACPQPPGRAGHWDYHRPTHSFNFVHGPSATTRTIHEAMQGSNFQIMRR